MGFHVDEPLWFLALVPAGLMVFMMWRSKIVVSKGRKRVLLTLRTLVTVLIISALAGVHILWPVEDLAAVFVGDLSESTGHEHDDMLEAVNQAIKEKASRDRIGVITAGTEAKVERPLTNRSNALTDFQTSVNPDHSNLASGLRLAGGLFSEKGTGRVVLMSDGNENIGDVKREARLLKRQGYVVDVLPFSARRSMDVAISSFDVPQTVYAGEKASLSLTLSSNTKSDSRVRIYQDNELILDETIPIDSGMNQYSFDHLIKQAGFHTYRAEVVTEGDQIGENNQLHAFTDAQGLPKVLIVEGRQGAAANAEDALQSSALAVEVTKPELLPTKLSAYLNYKSIILSNVPATALSTKQMTLIQKAVRDFGVGLIMTGGDESFGLGGYFQTPIEKALPVYMDIKGKKQMPSLGLMTVIDKSGSMGGMKISLAREAAARSVELLRPKDTLGVIAFDARARQIVKTGPIEDKQEIMDKIRSITASGGTNIFGPLSKAYEQIKPLKLQRKHIILLTDGHSATQMDYLKMIKNAKENQITISTIAVGPGADAALLQEIAEAGGGRFYHVLDVSSIPTIFSRETVLMTRTYIEDDPFHPQVVNGYQWRAHFQEGVPKMNAYIATTAKGRAQQVLVSKKQDPILTRWQYGLGKTAAWTSDLSGKWAGDWPVWQQWAPLWNDIVTWTFPQYDKEAYNVEKSINGNQVTLKITSTETDSSQLKAKLVNGEGKNIGLPLAVKAPGEYEGTFTASQAGVYYLQLTQTNGKKVTGSFKTGIVVPYSAEYASHEKNMKLLKEVADIGGGNVLESAGSALRELPASYKKQELFQWLLIAALLLFMLDVAVRRFRFDSAFVGKAFSDYRGRLSDQVRVREQKASQLGQISKKTKQMRKKNNRGPVKPNIERAIPKKHQGHKPTNPTQQDPSNSEEKMARLLQAKNRKKR